MLFSALRVKRLRLRGVKEIVQSHEDNRWIYLQIPSFPMLVCMCLVFYEGHVTGLKGMGELEGHHPHRTPNRSLR